MFLTKFILISAQSADDLGTFSTLERKMLLASSLIEHYCFSYVLSQIWGHIHKKIIKFLYYFSFVINIQDFFNKMIWVSSAHIFHRTVKTQIQFIFYSEYNMGRSDLEIFAFCYLHFTQGPRCLEVGL